MRTMSAKEAKNHFGELLMAAQKGPVTIEKNGRPTAVVVSWEDHERNEELRMERVRTLVQEGTDAADAGQVYEWTDELMTEILKDGPSRFDR